MLTPPFHTNTGARTFCSLLVPEYISSFSLAIFTSVYILCTTQGTQRQMEFGGGLHHLHSHSVQTAFIHSGQIPFTDLLFLEFPNAKRCTEICALPQSFSNPKQNQTRLLSCSNKALGSASKILQAQSLLPQGKVPSKLPPHIKPTLQQSPYQEVFKPAEDLHDASSKGGFAALA